MKVQRTSLRKVRCTWPTFCSAKERYSYQVTVPGDAPALAFPVGMRRPNDYFEGDLFTGLVYMSSIRFPLTAFAGIDLGNVVEVAPVFDRTDTAAGSLWPI